MVNSPVRKNRLSIGLAIASLCCSIALVTTVAFSTEITAGDDNMFARTYLFLLVLRVFLVLVVLSLIYALLHFIVPALRTKDRQLAFVPLVINVGAMLMVLLLPLDGIGTFLASNLGLVDYGEYCGDGSCDLFYGEDNWNCPIDCDPY